MENNKKLKNFIKTTIREFLNENISKDNVLNDLLKIFKTNTQFSSEKYPNKRYVFKIDKPSANTVYFRTKYFGDWKDNIQVSFTYGDDYIRISQGDNRTKSTNMSELNQILSDLHKNKVKEYGNYLTNEYSDDLQLRNMLVDI